MTPFPKSARRALGMSQRELANHLDVTDRTVRRWESESNPWPVPKLAREKIERMLAEAGGEKDEESKR